jgi:hypothetical protein
MTAFVCQLLDKQHDRESFSCGVPEFPKRSPHLNPVDHLWRDAKAVICANRQYATIDDEVERFTDYIYN